MVVGQESGGIGADDFLEGLVEGICGDGGIQAAEGIVEAASEEHLLEGRTLGGGLTWGDVWAEDRGEGFEKRFYR